MKLENEVILNINDTTIWNHDELLQFLIEWQGKSIHVAIPEGACLENLGVYRLLDFFSFKSVEICTNNIVESNNNYKIVVHRDAFQYFTVPPTIDYGQYHAWSGAKQFGVFYNRPTWPRVGLASYLHAKYPDKTLLNFRFDPHNKDQRPMFELKKLFDVDPESLQLFMNCYKDFPVQLETVDGCTIGDTVVNHTNQLCKFYTEFLIDVVVETFVMGRSFYPTEKTVRPMLMKKPFVMMGPKSFLIHLRQMGFRTFHDFWDEGYDGHDTEHRYKKILTLIDSLASKSHAELQDMYNHMQPVLDHNYELLLEKKFTTQINYVE
jgi:hypothetical protein